MYELLDHIDGPEDLKKLTLDQLPALCEEIRRYMVACCAVNPGHLGASLGAVELCVALHYVYDSPTDSIVFDVGHQAYAHKILTGRRDAFRHNRTKDGISGFPLREESPHDAFGAGHASTSISAALGMATARKISGAPGKAVALIGDGAMTGGLALEGLNNAGSSGADLLVILNENDQSIDRGIGALHNYLLNLTSHPTYNRIKTGIWDKIGEGRLRRWLQKITRDTKSNLVRGSGGALFEAFGFRYFGPIDGNDVIQLTETLRRLKDLPGPRLLHVRTVKGKGYAPAEADPTTWHAPGRFNPETGERKSYDRANDRWQDVFGATLCDLAKEDARVVGVTPAMASGCGMTGFAESFPDRFFDVGIEEEHAVTFSAGMAAAGLRPFCNIYSTFAQRAYDQVIHDLALQRLPVTLCLDRAGLVGEDGATHQGAFDLAAFRCIPNIVIAVPANEAELRDMMYTALSRDEGPFVIRYPRGCAEGVRWRGNAFRTLPVGKAVRLTEGSGRTAVLALGPFAARAMEAAQRLAEEGRTTPYIYNMRFLKPLDEEALRHAAAHCDHFITVEDGCLAGGLYGAVCEWVAAQGLNVSVRGVGLPDRFIGQDSQASQRAACGLNTDGILAALDDSAQRQA